MDIKNIALVRATNIIPFDGVVRPINEVPYLKKENGTTFAYAINDLLKKLNKINNDGYWTKTEEEQEKMDKQNKTILEKYLPYNSDYNSMVLWSLNGLVPNDINNTFSNKSCGIIESLEEQISESEIVSLVPTDTAIKGSVRLSSKAIILVNSEIYNSLSDEEKEKLGDLDLNVHIFDGELQEAIDENLEKSGRYTAEKLSLSRGDKGYLKSYTSEELTRTIQNVAEEYDIAQELHYNVLMCQNDELGRLQSVKDERGKIKAVKDCYKRSFFEYIFSKTDMDKRVACDVLRYMDSPVYIKLLTDEIEKIGIEEYKKVVDGYNSSLEELQRQGQLPTPEQIVDLTENNRDYSLITMIENLEKEQKDKNHDGVSLVGSSDETKITDKGKFLKTLNSMTYSADDLSKNMSKVDESDLIMLDKGEVEEPDDIDL